MFRLLYAVAMILLAWLLMQAVHEGGHVVAAWVTGATVERVVLHPLTISRTDVVNERCPLVVVWAGPIVGALVPLAVWTIVPRSRLVVRHAAGFFAGFCLIANGAYLAYGSIDGIGDAGELLSLGMPRWALWMFGVVTIPAGFTIWHRLGHRLGFREPTRPLRKCHTIIALAALLAVVLVEAVFSAR